MLNHAKQAVRVWAAKHKNCLLAFSGGLDSTLLLYLLKNYTKTKVTAITINTPYTPPWEVEEAKSFCKIEEIDHIILQTEIIKEIKENPLNRCYLCKQYFFKIIKNQAKAKNIGTIVDGTNLDDDPNLRPGMKVLKELGIVSPLRVAGLGKREIQNISRELNLPTSEKSSCSCLLTRLPYEYSFHQEELIKIAMAEQYLHKVMTDNVRVRLDNNSAIVEIGHGMISSLNNSIKSKLYSFGFDEIIYKQR